MTDAELREQIKTDIRSRKYMGTQLTDETLQAYFDEHHADFDGTSMRLEHIMIRPAGGRADAVDQSLAQMASIRQRISEDKVAFADAARQYSDAPSRRDGGDLGYIKRDAPWDPVFLKTAFALDEGQVSEPLVTDHGVHLIRCEKIRRGFKTFATMRDQVQVAAVDDLQKKMVDEQRAQTPVTFMGVVPHVDLETGQIVLPSQQPAAAASP
ncbi:MAG: peptidylprolyl isomerase [Pirellulales bacterium]